MFLSTQSLETLILTLFYYFSSFPVCSTYSEDSVIHSLIQVEMKVLVKIAPFACRILKLTLQLAVDFCNRVECKSAVVLFVANVNHHVECRCIDLAHESYLLRFLRSAVGLIDADCVNPHGSCPIRISHMAECGLEIWPDGEVFPFD